MNSMWGIATGLLWTWHTWALSINSPVDFSQDQLGLYTKDEFKLDWNKTSANASSGAGTRLNIVEDPDQPNHHVLQVTYLAKQVGGSSAMTFDAPLGGQYDHLFFQYRVRFPEDFSWVKGGKLPGLTTSPDSPTGCIANSTFDGFSARYMWREEGLLWGYIYNPVKQENCGDYYATQPPLYLQKNQWHTLKQEVYIGTPGVADGYIKVWINGGLVINVSRVLLRKSADIHIDTAKMDTFFGGSTADWAPETDQHIYFSDFIISEHDIN